MESWALVNKTEARGRAGKEGRKRAAAQSVTKHERKGEEIGDDRLQKKDVGVGMRQDQGEVQERIGLKELYRATCNPDNGLVIWNSRLHKSFHITVCLSESYCCLLTVLTGACQTWAGAKGHAVFPSHIWYSHMCFISILTGTHQWQLTTRSAREIEILQPPQFQQRRYSRQFSVHECPVER